MPNRPNLNLSPSFPMGPTAAAHLAAVLESRRKNPLDDELQSLLHRRLRPFSWLASLGMMVLVIRLAMVFRVLKATNPSIILIIVATSISMMLTTIYLNVRKDIPLLTLRRAELMILLPGTLAIGSWCYVGMIRGTAIETELPRELASFISSHSWALLSNRQILMADTAIPLAAPLVVNFGFAAVLYGILIPNTWRRCAVLLLSMVVISVGVPVAASISVGALRPILPRLIYAIASVTVLYSLAGLYGCHRLDVSRKQVYAAREVGPYRLLRRIGCGGMGEVFLARHKLLRRPCALKMIPPEHAGSRDRLARFELEVQAMALLTHPNTVEIYDYGHTDEGTFYYAMEFLPGVGLDQLVRYQGALPAGRALYLLHQVCGALHEAHMQGLIHRDIKPSNVIVCERGGQFDVAKLLDFGLVHVAGFQPLSGAGASAEPRSSPDLRSDSQLTEDGQVVGTPAYLSPEQALGQQADARSDVYSLGCLAYFLVTGRIPFASSSVQLLYEAHVSQKPRRLREIRPEVPVDVEDAILRCLEKDPVRRFQTVKELMAALSCCSAAREWDDAQAQTWWMKNQAWLAENGALSLAEEPIGLASVTREESESVTGSLAPLSAASGPGNLSAVVPRENPE